jgi:hypothetical protein
MSDAPTSQVLRPTHRYFLVGAAFGTAFPLVATLLDAGMRQIPFTIAGILETQAGQPLHWVIDSAPFVLGLFAALIGRRQEMVVALQNSATAQAVSEETDRFFRVAVRNGVYAPVSIDSIAAGTKVVDEEHFYEADRLRPKYTTFANKPLFIMTGG